MAPGLATALTQLLGTQVTAEDVLAYTAGVTSHPAFTNTFADELTTPGIRLPITADPQVWTKDVELGRQVVWLHTYGQCFTGEGRPEGDIRLPAGSPDRLLNHTPVTAMPETMAYDEDRQVILVGDGEFGPVNRRVWEYTIGGRTVVKSWFDYRKKEPAGRRSTPLDDINATTWDPDWTGELLDLLSALTRLANLEPQQTEILADILANDIFTTVDLAKAGVQWPTGLVPEEWTPVRVVMRQASG